MSKELPIRLSTSNHSRIENFMNDWRSTSYDHPFGGGKRIIHNTSVLLYPSGDHIHISDMQALIPRQGNGKLALNHLTSLANKHGVALKLTAMPYSNQKEHIRNEKTLKKFYVKSGFQQDSAPYSSDDELEYKPKKIDEKFEQDTKKIFFLEEERSPAVRKIMKIVEKRSR